MKAKNAFAFVVMLVLIVSALFIGAYKGWTEERAETESAAQPLDEALKTCVETANNILTVARRHVSTDDETVKALTADKATLESSKIGLQEKAEAAESLAKNAKALLATLSDTETVKADDRDKMYAEELLPQMLSSSELLVQEAAAQYNEAAGAFNERLSKNFFSGFLARLMGIQQAELYEAE